MSLVIKNFFSFLLILSLLFLTACQGETEDDSEDDATINIPENNLPIITHDYDALITSYLDKNATCKTIKKDTARIKPDFDKASQLYLEAFCYHLEEEKNDNDVLVILREAHKLAPNDKNGTNLYARLSYREDENVDSIRVFKQALSLSPENYKLYSWMSTTYGYMDEYEKAIEILHVGIKFAKKAEDKEQLATFYYEVGELYQDDDSYDEALKYFNLSIENRSEPNARLYNLTGMVHDDLDNVDDAIKMYEKAIATDSTFVCSYNNLGFLYNNNDRGEEAKAILNKALKADPGYDCGGMVYYNLGISYRNEGNCKMALTNFELSIENDGFDNGQSTEDGINFNIGRCNVLLDSYDKGIKFLLKDTSLDERSYYYLGLAYSKKKNSNKAIEYLEKAIDDEETARSLELLASSYFVKRQFDDAEKYYKKALEEDDTLALSYARLGLLAAMNNDIEKAVFYYKGALKNAPNNNEFKRQFFLIQIKNKNCKAAKKLIQDLSSHKQFDQLKNKLELCIE